MIAEIDSGAIEPSGSRAGTATELPVAKTPGPGSGEIRSCSPRSRASTVGALAALGVRCGTARSASTIAPSAAVISSAEVSSNANR